MSKNYYDHWMLFDEDGKFTSSLLEGIHVNDEAKRQELIAQGYVNIDHDTFNALIGNRGMGDNGTGYRYVNGRLVSAPAAEIDPEAEKKAKLAELDSQYENAKASLISQYAEAAAYGDADMQESIKNQLTELDADYDNSYNTIAGEE